VPPNVVGSEAVNHVGSDLSQPARAKLAVIAQKLESLGVLDVIEGVLSDKKQLSVVLRLLSSDNTVLLLNRLDSVISLIANLNYERLEVLLQLLTTETGNHALSRSVELLISLENRGLLEPLIGALNDEKTFSRIASTLSSKVFIDLLYKSEKLLGLLDQLDYAKIGLLITTVNHTRGSVEALGQALSLLAALDRDGLLEPILGILEDKQSMATIMKTLSNDRFLELLLHSQNLFTLLLNLADMDEELLSLITAMQTDTFKKILTAFKNASSDGHKPVKGVLGLLRELGDEDTARGMGVVFGLLQELGKQYPNN
jgi:uncharacterized protein YjgD (DUF1641 family)